MYAITATVTRAVGGGYTSTISTPTLFLDENVQGIVSVEHAEGIALYMIREIAGPGTEVHVTAVYVD